MCQSCRYRKMVQNIFLPFSPFGPYLGSHPECTMGRARQTQKQRKFQAQKQRSFPIAKTKLQNPPKDLKSPITTHRGRKCRDIFACAGGSDARYKRWEQRRPSCRRSSTCAPHRRRRAPDRRRCRSTSRRCQSPGRRCTQSKYRRPLAAMRTA